MSGTTQAPTPDPAPPERAPTPRRRRSGWFALAAALAVPAALATLLAWGLYTPRGTATLLGIAPSLSVTQPRGALLGGDFAAQRIEWMRGGSVRLRVDGLHWSGLHIGWHAGARPWLRVRVAQVALERFELRPSATQAAVDASGGAVPDGLRLPLALRIDRLDIGELVHPALGEQALSDVNASLELGADDGARHRVESLAFTRSPWRAQISGQIDADAPMQMQATLQAQPVARSTGPMSAWRASASARGPLARFDVEASLRSLDVGATDGPAKAELDLRASVLPFEAWPLAALDATTRALDLSRLVDGAPSTRIDASARVSTRGWDQPAQVVLRLDNRAAGRFDAARLPLQALAIDVQGRPDQPTRLELREFELTLGRPGNSAGRVEGRGTIERERVAVQMTLSDVRPDELDSRLAPTRLSGSMQIDATDWWPAPPGGVAAPALPRLALRARLDGALAGVANPVRIELDADASRERLGLQRLRLASGDAVAELSATAVRDAAMVWRASGQARLERFDPLPFWQGASDSPWRRGPHRVDGRVDFDVNAAQAAWRIGGATLLAGLRGRADLVLGDSVLAGVPVAGTLDLRSDGPALQVQGALDAAGNRMRVDGRAATQAPGHDDAWGFELHAPALAALDPLMRLVRPAGAARLELSGAIDANARVNGRWPSLRTEGQAQARQARIGEFAAAQAQARWRMGTAAHAPLELQAELAGVTLGARSTLDSATLSVEGSPASHRIEARASAPLRAPGWLEQMTAGAPPPAPAAAASAAGTSVAVGGAVALLSAQGGLVGDLENTGRIDAWRGSIQRVDLRPRGAPQAQAWLASSGLELALEFDPADAGLAGATLGAGRAVVVGATLAWSRVVWRVAGPGRAASLEANAVLEPIAVAPLLQRLQPGFGWVGDLTLAGHLAVRSAPTMQAEIVIERHGGDLGVRDLAVPELPVQSLGLSELRLGLSARDGLWQFTQALAGSNLGSAAGAQVLRTAPDVVWPAPETPLEGVLQANVAQLGAWGNWLPAGWRLVGSAHAGASIAGRFGEPEYTGEIRGSGIGVRNLLEGVDVHGGELLVSLQGPRARIETFVLHAGAGTVRLEGEGSLGVSPQARLRLLADRFELLGRVDRRLLASGDATLLFDAQAVRLDGRLAVDEGLFDFSRADAPGLSDDVQVLRPGDGVRSDVAPTRAMRRQVAVDLRVDLGRKLRVRGRGLDTLLRGELRVSAPGGRLAVHGAVRAEDGTYAAYGQKLDISRGDLRFNGPVESPALDVLAIRPNLDVRVGVAVTGTAASPRVRLYSEPAMSDMAKLSWLVLGREPDGLGRTDTALLQRAALALLSGESGGRNNDLVHAIGLDELSLRQSDGEVRETFVNVGKQIGRHWYVGYERSLNAATGAWQLIYRTAQRLTVRAQSGEDSSLDLLWTWRWK